MTVIKKVLQGKPSTYCYEKNKQKKTKYFSYLTK